MLVPRGELRKRALEKNLLTDAVMMSKRSDFADVQLITLKQFLRERAYEKAWQECSSPKDVEARAEYLLATEFTHSSEFVEITKNGIQVGVNLPEIDDNAIDRAVMLLVEAGSLRPGNKYKFGARVKVYDSKHSQTR